MGWLTLGLLAGVVYGIWDTAMDASLLKGDSLLAFSALHRFFNTITPPVAGMVVGVLFAYMRQRDARIEAERRMTEALRERLKGAERQQAVWLLASSLLHDVRNPLHALGLLLDEALEERNPVPESVSEALTRARAQADRIEQRIGSLREMAECPPRERSRVQAGTLLRGVASDLGELAARSKVKLQIGSIADVELEADVRYLRTPLENLVVNAIQATSERPGAAVRVEAVKAETELQVLVIDNGPGVPNEVCAVLFEPLQSAKNLGMGLGLPLARALARLEGGDVRLLRNGPPETVFELSIPLPREPGLLTDGASARSR
jgi:signal transduction histidine kinase